jgi:hypothetical protein
MPARHSEKNNIKAADAHNTLFAHPSFDGCVPQRFINLVGCSTATTNAKVTPRYLVDDILLSLNKSLTVAVKIDVSPYKSGDFQIGFARVLSPAGL